jgi:hypothetical protein
MGQRHSSPQPGSWTGLRSGLSLLQFQLLPQIKLGPKMPKDNQHPGHPPLFHPKMCILSLDL